MDLSDYTPPTLSTIIRCRLITLLARHRLSRGDLAERLDVHRSTVNRKLRPDDAGSSDSTRNLTVADCDLILEALGELPTALLSPVLLEGDDLALRWVGARTPVAGPSSAMVANFIAEHETGSRPTRLLRLLEQGLVAPDGERAYALRPTGEGLRALSS